MKKLFRVEFSRSYFVVAKDGNEAFHTLLDTGELENIRDDFAMKIDHVSAREQLSDTEAIVVPFGSDVNTADVLKTQPESDTKTLEMFPVKS